MREELDSVKDHTRLKKIKDYKSNMETLYLSEYNFPRRFEVKDESCTVLFRDRGKRRVTFFPSTNRWVLDNRVFLGDATAFLEWYATADTSHNLRSCTTCRDSAKRRGDAKVCRQCADKETMAQPKPNWRAKV